MFSFLGEPSVEESTAEAGSSSEATPIHKVQQVPAAFGFNLWGVANAVSNTVKATAGDLVKTVQSTDWKAELTAFSKEVESDTRALKNKTAEIVEHLPDVVEGLPARVANQASHVSSGFDDAHGLDEMGDSLSRFGQSLLSGTKELLDQVREAVESEISTAASEQKRAVRSARTASKSGSSTVSKSSAAPAKYSRFDAEVSAMQRDSSTYCDEPADLDDFTAWAATFSLQERHADVSATVANNAFMADLQARLVPVIVEHHTFWLRYFYRLHKLQQKEAARQQLAARATFNAEEEEDLGWGDDADEEAESQVDGLVPSVGAHLVDGDTDLGGNLATTAFDQSPRKVGELSDVAQNPVGAKPAGTVSSAAVSKVNNAVQQATSTAVPDPDTLPAAYGLARDSRETPTSTSPPLPLIHEDAPLTAQDALAASSATAPPAAAWPSPTATSPQSTSSRAPRSASGSPSVDGVPSACGVSHGGSTEESLTVETASDCSGRGEWCVVNEHKHAGPGVLSIASDSSGPVPVIVQPAPSADPAAAHASAAAVGGPSSPTVAPPTTAGGDGASSGGRPAAVPPALPGPPRGPRIRQDEDEEDLDWGTWD